MSYLWDMSEREYTAIAAVPASREAAWREVESRAKAAADAVRGHRVLENMAGRVARWDVIEVDARGGFLARVGTYATQDRAFARVAELGGR
jgi:hypothetical protein